MTALDLLSPAELARLDIAIDCIPPDRLREKTAALLLRAGMRPTDILRARRSGFAPGDSQNPPQLTHDSKTGEDVTTLTPAAAAAVSTCLASHSGTLILPGMNRVVLESIAASRLEEAGIRNVSLGTLRNSVRLAAMAEAQS